eukprot:TRINITY_DN14240_c0_g1_i9.p2 TRINITY_DN14240_c0_g1~~TRINITY_DN14240_c0_g1_i9.p2  ORF type:complete len:265 (-),score=24.37 TRINITY_DN14240_c0_g1_i9:1035-1829(-)
MWSKVAKDACLKILETNVLVCAHTKKDEGSIGLGAAELYVDDNVLYVAGNKGLALFDISNPMASQRIGDIIDTGALSFHGGAMFVENSNLLYLAGGNGLRVLDTTDPKKPALLGSVIDTGIIADDAGLAGALVVASAQPLRHCLYMAGGKGLAVLDLTVPTVPSVIRSVKLSVVHGNSGVAMVLLETKNIIYCKYLVRGWWKGSLPCQLRHAAGVCWFGVSLWASCSRRLSRPGHLWKSCSRLLGTSEADIEAECNLLEGYCVP